MYFLLNLKETHTQGEKIHSPSLSSQAMKNKENTCADNYRFRFSDLVGFEQL